MTDDKMRGPLMTLQEVAEYLGLSRGSLYNLRSAGRGPYGFRVGKQLRFRSSDIEQWLESRRDQPHDRRTE